MIQRPRWVSIRHYTAHDVEAFLLYAVKYEVIRQVRRSVERNLSDLIHDIQDQLAESAQK